MSGCCRTTRYRAAPVLLALALLLALSACGPGPQSSAGTRPADSAAAPETGAINRTLVLLGRSEMPSLALRPIQSLGLTSSTGSRIFNSGLALEDDRGAFQPYLAEALPQLNSESWRVFPDGRMETVYRLKPGLVWHDGAPLTAEDFVFSWQVYAVPELGQAASPPIALMEEVVATDPRTITIRWGRPYPDAGQLSVSSGSGGAAFAPLPRHLLTDAFQQGSWDSFAALPFWTVEYVGLGPYKLDRWEAGAFIEGVAFAGHALGKPKIERIRMVWSPDFNTTVANMLGGEGHMTIDDSIRFQQAMILRQNWGDRGGTVLVYPSLWRWLQMQQRPELASPRALLDLRVRKALAHAVDKQALDDALFEGEGIMTEVPVPPNADYFAQVDAAAAKYPYDPRRTEQLMAEAGFTRGSDGVYAGRGERFAVDFVTFQSPQNESEMSITAASLRAAGFDVREHVWPGVRARDTHARNTATGLSGTSGPAGEQTLAAHSLDELPTADNRWQGPNRGGWQNAEFSGLADTFVATLERGERIRLLTQMVRVFTEDAAVISLYFNPSTPAFVSGLVGPKPVVPTSTIAWNIHEWHWTK
jgi:peptide/nickel transport system substrate-binding protein